MAYGRLFRNLYLRSICVVAVRPLSPSVQHRTLFRAEALALVHSGVDLRSIAALNGLSHIVVGQSLHMIVGERAIRSLCAAPLEVFYCDIVARYAPRLFNILARTVAGQAGPHTYPESAGGVFGTVGEGEGPVQGTREDEQALKEPGVARLFFGGLRGVFRLPSRQPETGDLFIGTCDVPGFLFRNHHGRFLFKAVLGPDLLEEEDRGRSDQCNEGNPVPGLAQQTPLERPGHKGRGDGGERRAEGARFLYRGRRRHSRGFDLGVGILPCDAREGEVVVGLGRGRCPFGFYPINKSLMFRRQLLFGDRPIGDDQRPYKGIGDDTSHLVKVSAAFPPYFNQCKCYDRVSCRRCSRINGRGGFFPSGVPALGFGPNSSGRYGVCRVGRPPPGSPRRFP